MSLIVPTRLRAEWKQTDYRAREIIIPDAVRFCSRHAWNLHMTSVFRDDDSTHNCPPPHRFVDLDIVRSRDWRKRDHLGHWAMAHSLERHLNRRYRYGKSWSGKLLNVAWFHTVGDQSEDTEEGWHLHVQVPFRRMGLNAPGG